MREMIKKKIQVTSIVQTMHEQELRQRLASVLQEVDYDIYKEWFVSEEDPEELESNYQTLLTGFNRPLESDL